jgi:hypothetical protein
MNNIFHNDIINFNISQNNDNLINIQKEQQSQKDIILLMYFFRLFLLYKLLPIILLNLSKLLYFFSLYLVNYSDENNF